MKTKLFQKTGVDICSPKSMFNFINGHFTYWTMNSWNRLESIANNMKLYNLKLEGDWTTVLDYLYDEQDIGDIGYQVHELITEFERKWPTISLGFNGRSSGYLVMYNKERDGRVNFRNILPDDLTGFDNYEDWKEYVKEWGNNVSDYTYELREYTELIRDFDKLCEDLRDLANEYSKLDYQAERLAYEEAM